MRYLLHSFIIQDKSGRIPTAVWYFVALTYFYSVNTVFSHYGCVYIIVYLKIQFMQLWIRYAALNVHNIYFDVYK